MRIFVLGGTGSIGTAVTPELVSHGHDVLALARSDSSARALRDWGAEVVRGDVTSDDVSWATHIGQCDAVINLADTFEENMAEVEPRISDLIIAQAATMEHPLRVLWTGGCWQYGATGDRVATEDDEFHPISFYKRAQMTADKLLAAENVSPAILHPAMVYHKSGGVFERFIDQAQTSDPIDIWGGPDTRWPLVHRDDVAVAYRLLAEHADLVGHFNVTAEQGIRVGDIVDAIAQHHDHRAGRRVRAMEEVVAENGAWAEGPTLDQQISAEKIMRDTGWRPQVTSFQASDLFD
ncbi:MAG: NAD-dependent epimerase/dehydratase family protein [Pseudomonadota bacterium]